MAQPSDVVPVGDRRVFFIDQNSQLLLLDQNGLQEAYRVPLDSGNTIQSVALDVDFDSTGYVYVAVATGRDERLLSIVRFREVRGTLGEAATIVPDIPMSPLGDAALSVGADRHLYIALPAADLAVNGQRGVVLRFDGSGAAQGLANLASPVLAESNPRPSKLAWQDDRLWLGGLAGSNSPVLGRLMPNSESEPRPLRPLAVSASTWPASESGVRDLAPLAISSQPGTSNLLVVLENPRTLSRVVVEDGGLRRVVQVVSVPLGSLVPEAVAVSAATEEIYLAAMTDASSTARGMIIRLRPEPVVRAIPR